VFSSDRTSKLAQRALGAVQIARSFLLLEDDYDVDWEVGQDGHGPVSHPHRAPLRGGFTQRRAGQLPAPAQTCLCAVAHAAPARRTRAIADLRADAIRANLERVGPSRDRGANTERTGSRVALER
jgi:hypothetical protein